MTNKNNNNNHHYVSNKEFYNIIKKYKEECEYNISIGKPKPRIPNAAASVFLRIADRYASKSCFFGYSFIEDMKGDGILACIKYFDTFNVERSNNPFAYFTQVIKNAFINKINIEEKETYIKGKHLLRIDESFIDTDELDEKFEVDGFLKVIDNFERKIKEKKQKRLDKIAEQNIDQDL